MEPGLVKRRSVLSWPNKSIERKAIGVRLDTNLSSNPAPHSHAFWAWVLLKLKLKSCPPGGHGWWSCASTPLAINRVRRGQHLPCHEHAMSTAMPHPRAVSSGMLLTLVAAAAAARAPAGQPHLPSAELPDTAPLGLSPRGHAGGEAAANPVWNHVWHGARLPNHGSAINGSDAVGAAFYIHELEDVVYDARAWEDCGCPGPTPSCDTAMGMACPRPRCVHALACMCTACVLFPPPRFTSLLHQPPKHPSAASDAFAHAALGHSAGAARAW